jgi:hypothetical protein
MRLKEDRPKLVGEPLPSFIGDVIGDDLGRIVRVVLLVSFALVGLRFTAQFA